MKTEMQQQPIPESITTAIGLLRQAADQEGLSHAARLQVVNVVRRAIVPKSQQLDSAYGDYKAGMRGLKLYCKHIPDFPKLSLWHRREKQNRLLKALQRRAERDQLDSAYGDYKAGMRGLKLYCKHIPDFPKLSLWHRREKQNRLLKALQKRAEREKKHQRTATAPLDELSPRQPASPNGHPDNAA